MAGEFHKPRRENPRARVGRCVRVPSIGNRTISIDTVLDETARDRKVVNALVTNVERDNRIGYGPLKRLRHLTNALQTAICRRYVTFRLRLATFEMDFPVNQTSVMPTANPINPPLSALLPREKRRARGGNSFVPGPGATCPSSSIALRRSTATFG